MRRLVGVAEGGRTGLRGRARSDRGVSAIEFALLTPILLLTIMLVIQYAMYFHARHVASAAAQEGARVATSTATSTAASGGTTGGWQAPAVQQAAEYLEFIGGRLIVNEQITTYVTVQGHRGVKVTGHAVEVLPFLTLKVVQRSSGPVECFRSDDGVSGCG